MSVQVRHIQYVIAAAEHGSFRRAAAALSIQESAISRRIRELEERLGTTFFIRSPSGVTLTHAGKQFVLRGRKVMSEIGFAKAEATAIGRGDEGHVRIGIFSSLASGFLSDLVQSFRSEHRAVKFTFIEGNPAEHVAAIRSHQLDVAFLTNLAEWPECDSQRLWCERVYAVLPLDHHLADKKEIEFTQLAGETFIVSESAPGEEIHNYLLNCLSDAGSPPEIILQAVGRDNLMRLVALGLGLTVTSEATTGAHFPGVVFRPISGQFLPFFAVWSPRNYNPALRSLLDLARAMAATDGEPALNENPRAPFSPALPLQSRDPSG